MTRCCMHLRMHRMWRISISCTGRHQCVTTRRGIQRRAQSRQRVKLDHMQSQVPLQIVKACAKSICAAPEIGVDKSIVLVRRADEQRLVPRREAQQQATDSVTASAAAPAAQSSEPTTQQATAAPQQPAAPAARPSAQREVQPTEPSGAAASPAAQPQATQRADPDGQAPASPPGRRVSLALHACSWRFTCCWSCCAV